MIYCLEQNKGGAVKLIEESPNNLVSSNGSLGSVRGWKLKDCVAVHKILETVFNDNDAATRWRLRCAEYFPYSTYFEGKHCSTHASNKDSKQTQPENGLAEFLPSSALKNLAI
ncbi:hypothetical protein M8C21_016098 [Ambrosia artemisiifolia]|uniref:Uncharacterized protein n=1 Tax=Ambrosia artemisiifolia TaxID=4212 RepID=A0AAD5C7I9_AMBAR|nr:hypothetical protein M8C21_016098 [Ambrosia artemisiifolia]